MLCSIVMPLHNGAAYIEEAIDSIIAQTHKTWELIVVDDFSTDNGPLIVQRFAMLDNRITLIRSAENLGAAVTRNIAIDKAQGDFIAFLDCDDLWLPNKLSSQISFMQKNGYEFTFTWYDKVGESGEGLRSTVKPDHKISYRVLLRSNQIGCLTVMYDSRKLGKMYMPNLRKRQDYALWLKILKQVEFGYCLDSILARHRIRRDSLSQNKFSLIKYNWRLFRGQEKMGLAASSYYLFVNIILKFVSK